MRYQLRQLAEPWCSPGRIVGKPSLCPRVMWHRATHTVWPLFGQVEGTRATEHLRDRAGELLVTRSSGQWQFSAIWSRNIVCFRQLCV
jgi:hypothetical protein